MTRGSVSSSSGLRSPSSETFSFFSLNSMASSSTSSPKSPREFNPASFASSLACMQVSFNSPEKKQSCHLKASIKWRKALMTRRKRPPVPGVKTGALCILLSNVFTKCFSFGRRGRGIFGEEHRLLGVRYTRVVEVRSRALCFGELVAS